MPPKMSAADKKWQAEQDAHTLAEAEAIKADKSRSSAAAGAATRMADEQEKRAKAMRKVAKPAPKKPAARKPAPKKRR